MTKKLLKSKPVESRWGADEIPDRKASLLTKINSTAHYGALKWYLAIVIAHWIEHLVQAFQVYILRMPTPQAGGFLGYLLPETNKNETLHWTYAIVMFAGLLLLRRGFTDKSKMWWNLAIWIMAWHLFEHTFLFCQYWSGHYFFSSSSPTSVLQVFFPRVELHLIYNMLVMLPILAALSSHWFNASEAKDEEKCNCRQHFE